MSDEPHHILRFDSEADNQNGGQQGQWNFAHWGVGRQERDRFECAWRGHSVDT